MKIPIQYALTYPSHSLAEWDELDLAKIGKLTFEEKDIEKLKDYKYGFTTDIESFKAPKGFLLFIALLASLFELVILEFTNNSKSFIPALISSLKIFFVGKFSLILPSLKISDAVFSAFDDFIFP